MSGIDSIPVRVEGGDTRTQNLRPLLLQIEQAVNDLHASGSETVIDLTAMPFSEQDEADLRAALGLGEVSARVDAFGPSLVAETGIRGVWIVEHKDADDKRLMLHLEVTRVPSLLVTPEDDVADSIAAMAALNAAQTGPSTP